MTDQELKNILQTSLMELFNIPTSDIAWDEPLVLLHDDYKLLSGLLKLEEVLNEKLQTELMLVENISSYLHTPNDLLHLLLEKMQ